MLAEQVSCKAWTLAVALLVFANFEASSAFSLYPACDVRRSSKLALLPGEGAQLEAAYNAAICGENQMAGMSKSRISKDFEDYADDDEYQEGDVDDSLKPAASPRSLVARLFQLPAVRHPFKSHLAHGDEEEALYYPIVGCQLVRDVEGNLRVLPAEGSGAACPLPPTDEALYGWYSRVRESDLHRGDHSQESSGYSSP